MDSQRLPGADILLSKAWEQLFPITQCSRRARVDCGVRSTDPLPHQDLVFDLGDPVRWEYLLLEIDKPHLSMTEEDDSDLNDDDIKTLVRLSHL